MITNTINDNRNTKITTDNMAQKQYWIKVALIYDNTTNNTTTVTTTNINNNDNSNDIDDDNDDHNGNNTKK